MVGFDRWKEWRACVQDNVCNCPSCWIRFELDLPISWKDTLDCSCVELADTIYQQQWDLLYQFISSTWLSVHPAVTPRKSVPHAKGCIYGHVSAGHFSNYSNIHGCWMSLTLGDLLSKLMPCCCLTSEPMSHSVGSLDWRWFLVKDIGPQGGEDLGLLIPLW